MPKPRFWRNVRPLFRHFSEPMVYNGRTARAIKDEADTSERGSEGVDFVARETTLYAADRDFEPGMPLHGLKSDDTIKFGTPPVSMVLRDTPRKVDDGAIRMFPVAVVQS